MVWYIDPHHTQATFSVKHMMVSSVRGRLGKLRGAIDIDPTDPRRASFEIGADVTAIDTGDARRDGHLRSADFFDVENYPEIVFKSSAIFPKGDDLFAVSGDLTIRGVTRPVTFDVELEGIGVDGKGGQHLGASATATIDRKDFGLVWNQPVQNGVLVGDKVKIEVGLEAVDAASAKAMGLAA
jgi:polyisoprenoid-binding protein YceI